MSTGGGCLRLRRLGRNVKPGGLISAAESIGRASGLEPTPSEAAHEAGALFETYSRQVFAFCLSRLGSREEAEDAVQSTFLNAHRALQRGVSPETELAWLLKIAHNVCLTRRRSTSRRGRVEAAHDLEAMQDYLPAPSRESPDELIRLTDALEDLPDSQRRAILLREWQGLSYAEIARELKVTQSAVETLIFRARRSLAANLQAVVVKPRVLVRARHAVELGWLVHGLRALSEGGVAVKAATAAAAVSSAALLATSSDAPTPKPVPEKSSAPIAAVVPDAATPPVARPRLRERRGAAPSTRSVARTSHEQPAAVVAPPAASEQTAKPKVEKTRPLQAHAPKAKKPKHERAAKPKVAKAKRMAAPVAKKPKAHAGTKPKAKAKVKAKAKQAPPKKAQPVKAEHTPTPKPEKTKAPASPEKPKTEPEPGNGKTK